MATTTLLCVDDAVQTFSVKMVDGTPPGSDGSEPLYVLETEQHLTHEAAKRLGETWRAATGTKAVVLEGGLKARRLDEIGEARPAAPEGCDRSADLRRFVEATQKAIEHELRGRLSRRHEIRRKWFERYALGAKKNGNPALSSFVRYGPALRRWRRWRWCKRIILTALLAAVAVVLWKGLAL